MADLNADGRLDLAVANAATGAVSILLGKGDGAFLPPVPYIVGADPRSLAVGDLDRDGVPDTATANQGAGTISVLISTGDGTFIRGADVPSRPSPELRTIIDRNGDGFVDLLLTTTSGIFAHSLLYLPGKGDGSFGPGIALQATYSPFEDVAAADQNGHRARRQPKATPFTYCWDGATARSGQSGDSQEARLRWRRQTAT